MRTAGPGLTWRVWVTEGDLREARAAWLQARDGGAPPDRVLELREELERMTRTAAFQSAGDLASSRRDPGPLRVPSPVRRSIRPPQVSAAR